MKNSRPRVHFSFTAIHNLVHVTDGSQRSTLDPLTVSQLFKPFKTDSWPGVQWCESRQSLNFFHKLLFHFSHTYFCHLALYRWVPPRRNCQKAFTVSSICAIHCVKTTETYIELLERDVEARGMQPGGGHDVQNEALHEAWRRLF